jgi:putative endonuclease
MPKSEKSFAVYIMASKRNGTLYIGVTSDLVGRVYHHKAGTYDGFTKKYKVHMLVWYEIHGTADTALSREKQLKEWNRIWKLRLIEEMNPDWSDLSADFTA